MRRQKQAVSLVEVLVAVAILAVLGGPMISNLVFSRRSVKLTARSIRAILRTGAVLEVLQGVPYEKLPVVTTGQDSECSGAIRGVSPGRWSTGFRGDPGVTPVSLPELVSPDPAGGELTTFLWIEALSTPEEPVIEAKEITVVVEYYVQAGSERFLRSHALRAMVLRPSGGAL